MNLTLGVWIAISALVLPQAGVSMANTFIVGAVIATASVLAFARAPLRWVNTVLALWLFASTLFLVPAGTAARWSNLFGAVAVLLFSVVPGSHYTTSGHPHRIARA
jgi:hypothetical protein